MRVASMRLRHDSDKHNRSVRLLADQHGRAFDYRCSFAVREKPLRSGLRVADFPKMGIARTIEAKPFAFGASIPFLRRDCGQDPQDMRVASAP